MKADKRSKIELRMEQLEKELLHVKQERDLYYNKLAQYMDRCSVLENEAKDNAAYIIELENKLHSAK